MTPQALEKAMVALSAQTRRLATVEKQVAAYWTAVYFRDALAADPARTWKGLLLHWIRQASLPRAWRHQLLLHVQWAHVANAPLGLLCSPQGAWQLHAPGSACRAPCCQVQHISKALQMMAACWQNLHDQVLQKAGAAPVGLEGLRMLTLSAHVPGEGCGPGAPEGPGRGDGGQHRPPGRGGRAAVPAVHRG